MATRSACTTVSLPCTKPMWSPSARTVVTGSIPCHQKWLGSRLTLTLPSVTPASSSNEAAL
jgi:hypothetical protein